MEHHDIPYFRKLWQINMSDLENQCQVWEKIIADNEIPDEVHGDIRTTIGLARLLMNQKLKQFKGLIDDSEFNTGEKEITCSDLEGFWDMVYFEVEKIQKNFKRFDKCKSNQWIYEDESSEKSIKKKITIKKDDANIAKKNELRKTQLLAAKQRLAEVKRKMMADRKEGKNQNFVEILQPNKTEQSQFICSVVNENISSAAPSEDKIATSEHNAYENVSMKAIQSIEVEEANKMKGISNQKSAQKKKHPSSSYNKENVLKGSKEVQDPEKIRRKSKDYGKLQCVTRSAAKAMLLQQNITSQK